MDNNYYGNICYCRRCDGIVHTIKRGDSLYLLSRYYNVPIGEIMNANRNLNVYNLQIGQEICIPMRRSDMMNDGPSQVMPREQMMNRDMSDNALMNSNTSDDTMMNRHLTSDAMPNRDMTVSDISSESSDFHTTTFDTGIRMSELLQQDDMTFEAFRNLMAEHLK